MWRTAAFCSRCAPPRRRSTSRWRPRPSTSRPPSPTARRWTRRRTPSSTGRGPRLHRGAYRAEPVGGELLRHRWAPGERRATPPAARRIQAVQLQREDRSCADDAGAGPPAGDPRFLRAHDLVPAQPLEAQRDGAGRRGRRPVGEVHPRRLRQGDVDLLRRSRSRGPAAPDRRPPDGPVAAPALAGVSSHPQQRAVSGGEEARAQDVSVERLAPAVRELVRAEIAAAHGREVSFVARPDANGVLVQARPVARGTVDAVLALPGIAERGELLLHNHPSGVLEPSGADLTVAARLHDGGVGFAIVDNAVTDCYVVVECPRPRATTRIDPIDVAALLSPSGPVARALGSFEDRPSQRDMTAYVADLYNDGGVGMLEAGTGVGKSFAYLVPALVWARENGERTVVSTNTINLQEQLVG